MTTKFRNLALGGTVAAIVVVLIVGGVLFLRTRSDESTPQRSIGISAQGTSSEENSAEDSTGREVDGDTNDSVAGATTQGSGDAGASAPSAAAASDSTASPAQDATAQSGETAGAAEGTSESAGGLRLTPGSIPRITGVDLVAPSIGAARCSGQPINYFEVYVTDTSDINQVSVQYRDGDRTRTTTLNRLSYHGDGNYYVGYLTHISIEPLADFYVTASDVRGNSTRVQVRPTCS